VFPYDILSLICYVMPMKENDEYAAMEWAGFGCDRPSEALQSATRFPARRRTGTPPGGGCGRYVAENTQFGKGVDIIGVE
jgi:hypothetical protein